MVVPRAGVDWAQHLSGNVETHALGEISTKVKVE
jgi:hypothetical protein